MVMLMGSTSPGQPASCGVVLIPCTHGFTRYELTLFHMNATGAMAFARLLSESGQRDQARRALAPVYARFTEGFETADLQTALRALTSIGAGNCTVTGTPGSEYVVEFISGKAKTDMDAMTGVDAVPAPFVFPTSAEGNPHPPPLPG